MKIALIGASGFVGTAILNEAVSRGHHVTAIVRDVSKVAAHPQVTAVAVDAQDSQALAKVLKGHDRVISAYNPGWTAPDIYDQYLKGPAPSWPPPSRPTAGCWWSAVPAVWKLPLACNWWIPGVPGRVETGALAAATVSPPCAVKPPSTGVSSPARVPGTRREARRLSARCRSGAVQR